MGIGKVCLVFLVVALIITAVQISANYEISNTIDGWKSRAQVSSEPNDMHEYMSKVKYGMEQRGLTSGNARWIFQTPEYDMALIYRAVCQHVDQAKILTGMDRSSPEYQTGLDNLRGSIRELNIYAFKYWSNHHLLLAFMSWVTWIGFIITGLIKLASS